MRSLAEKDFQRVAVHLITFKNYKAKYRIKKKGLDLMDLVDLDHRELNVYGFSPEDIQNLKHNYKAIAEKEIEKCRNNGIELIFKENGCYPYLLSEIFDPPDFLYLKGDKSVLKTEKIAVVGSRRGSSYGRSALNHIVPDLCRSGLTIVSGMAYGIDSMSQRIAVREKGKAIGVNAGGLLHLYPAGNRSLIKELYENGCIISEFPLDTFPRPFFFPIRNRIIAGMSKAVLVIEAALKSGSLITARLAIEQNRDVYAVPGPINSPLSQGTNDLIAQGAKLIRNAQDVLDEYGMKLKSIKKDESLNFGPKEKKLLDLMGENEVKNIDYFVEHLDLSVSEIISLLMGMILKNVVVEEEGGYRRLV